MPSPTLPTATLPSTSTSPKKACSGTPKATPPPQGGPHPLAFRLAETDRLLKHNQQRLSCCAHRRPHEPLGEQGMLSAFRPVPQYDRTHLQGCVCRPALAGGGCCPSGAAGAAAAQPPAPHAAGHSTLYGAAVGLGLLMAPVSFYFGRRTSRLGREALGHIHRAQARSQERQAEIAQRRRDLAPQVQLLPESLARLERAYGTEAVLQRDLVRSQNEQSFYVLVPGGLQQVAAVGLGLGSLDHLLHHALANATQLSILGILGPALFALYGGAFAFKNAWSAASEPTQPSGAQPAGSGAQTPFQAAVSAFGQARRRQAILSALSWGTTAVATGLGVLMTVGALGIGAPWVPAALIGLSLVGSVWAACTNACSRFAPHLPVTPHMERSRVSTSEARRQLWRSLSSGDQAVKEAVLAMQSERQGLGQRLMRLKEAAIEPQCGPRSFKALPACVAQDARAAHQGDVAAKSRQQRDEAHQLKACRALLAVEIGLMAEEVDQEVASLDKVKKELLSLLTGDAIDPQQPLAPERASAWLAQQDLSKSFAPVLGDLQEEAQAHARRADGRGLRLVALRQMQAELDGLGDSAGMLSAAGQSYEALTPAQQRWVRLRVGLLLATGTLRDALDDPTFLRLHKSLGLGRKVGSQLPYLLNNMDVSHEHLAALCREMSPTIDYGFVHALLNPRRIEAELDALLTLELEPPLPAANFSGLPEATGGFSPSQPDLLQASADTCCGG